MSKVRDRLVGKKALVSALLVAVTLLAMLMGGCSGKTSGASSSDQKAMLEIVGKFYAAQGALDLPAIKEILYDPQNVSGIATATVPAGAQKTEIVWKQVGDTVVITAPSEELTLTAVPATSPVNAVRVTAPNGGGETIVMKKVDGKWKIDVAETQKASAADAVPAPGPANP